MKTNETKLLTRKELCARLQISHPIVKRLEKKGLPYITFGSSHRRYDINKVLQWMEEQNHE